VAGRLGSDDREAAAARGDERWAEGAAGVLDRAQERGVQNVGVGERCLVDRLPAAPAADEVQQGVHPAEAPEQFLRPGARRTFVGEVDGPGIQALVRERQLVDQRGQTLGRSPCQRQRRPVLREATGDGRPQRARCARDGDDERLLHQAAARSGRPSTGSSFALSDV
jgi:hypothetical protein